ncbi:uncharacterized protein RJT21DRAFT_49043 [Scheffersomyces amazonensis]|uniref:uncharacterized protein n=1 Tax=Scheffersomyces amazonensis TaxID=1078765 RepID=UPI00315DC16B
MLIKPLGEYKAPRHTLDAEEDTITKPFPKPIIVVELVEDIKSIDYVVISPSTLSVLSDSFESTKIVGSIQIIYDLSVTQSPSREGLDEEDAEDYNIIEQLYSANRVNRFETNILGKIDIKLHTSGTNSVISIVIPRFSNIITFNLIAKAITEKFIPLIKNQWIVLAPCSLNNNSTINKLIVNSHKSTDKSDEEQSQILEAIPYLKPPHFITGISGAIVSQLNKLEQVSVLTLVLDSEGHSGFEKSSSDSIVDSAFVLGSILLPDSIKQHEYVKAVSEKVRKLNGFSNSGMYI